MSKSNLEWRCSRRQRRGRKPASDWGAHDTRFSVERRENYWVVRCIPPLSCMDATRIHNSAYHGTIGAYSGIAPILGSVARVHGYSRGVQPWGDVDHFHVDTRCALKALIRWLRFIAVEHDPITNQDRDDFAAWVDATLATSRM